MQRRKATRVVIAEGGSPWFSLVSPSHDETLVLAQMPDEKETDFGRRVKGRLAELAHVTDILVVSRRKARERVEAMSRWTVERLPYAAALS